MENAKVSLVLAGPAKIGGRWHKEGATVTVSEATAAQLGDDGLVAQSAPAVLVAGLSADELVDTRGGLPGAPKIITVSEDDFHAAVAAQAKALSDGVMDAVIQQACERIIAERDAAVEGLSTMTARVEQLEALLSAERTAHDQTREDLAQAVPAKPAQTPDGEAAHDLPSDVPAAKTAPKKGAAAKG